jgi:class 3 adenylate cyclase
MEFRIGINVGDVIVEGPQIYGDGVNIAARLQALAACYAELGRLEEARAEMAEALRLNPAYSLEAMKQTLPYKL